jgi:hypothetical protein
MTATSSLDIKGDIKRHPFAELLAEIRQAGLSGSVRLSRGSHKTIVYVKGGRVVHAVSNAREHRLFNVCLDLKKFSKETLAKHPNFANDIEFAASLRSTGQMDDGEVRNVTITQIERILIDTLQWTDGQWTYTPHARIRSDLVFELDEERILIDFARCLPGKTIYDRFKTVDELFSLSADPIAGLILQPQEKYVLDRFADQDYSIAQLRTMSTLPEAGLMQALYVLWMGGLIDRRDWVDIFGGSRWEGSRLPAC